MIEDRIGANVRASASASRAPAWPDQPEARPQRPRLPSSLSGLSGLNGLRGAGAALLLGLVAGCGGGGGGDAGAPGTSPTALDISSSNRDGVARTVATALAAMSMTDAVSTQLPSSTTGPRAMALGTAWLPAQALASVQAALTRPQMRAQAAGAEGRAHAQAVFGPFTVGCAAGGTEITTYNLASATGVVAAGDSMTVAYNNCRESSNSVLNGQLDFRFSSLTQGNTPSVVATITFTNFASTENSNAITVNGRVRMDFVQRSTLRQDTTLTTETDVTAQTRVGSRNDTVTLQAGYSTLSVVETDVSPPEGGFAGRATVTTQGTVASSALGGSVVLSTPSPLVAYFVDDYPRSGSILASGRNSSLRMTAVSATQVRLDLDSNGDGTVDSSSTVPWSSLE